MFFGTAAWIPAFAGMTNYTVRYLASVLAFSKLWIPAFADMTRHTRRSAGVVASCRAMDTGFADMAASLSAKKRCAHPLPLTRDAA